MHADSLTGRTILQIVPALHTGGVEHGVLDIASALVAVGAKALVVSEGGSLVAPLEHMGAQHIGAPVASKNPWRIYKNIQLIENICRQHQVDVVHVRSRAPALSAYWACHNLRLPMVTTFHGAYSVSGLGGLKKRYNAQMLRGVCVMAPSRFIADHLRTIYGVPDDFIRIVTEGADTGIFDPARIEPEAIDTLRRHWGCLPGETVFMLPGRFTSLKGHHHLLAALAPLKDRPWRLVFVGDDTGRTDYTARLKAYSAEHGLQAKVVFHGRCDVMPLALMAADVVVSASQKPESFGRVMVEAGAMGKPVLATNHGGATEIIHDTLTGWLVPPHDLAALTQALSMIMDLPSQQRMALGAAGQKRVRDHFTLRHFQSVTLDTYRDILHR